MVGSEQWIHYNTEMNAAFEARNFKEALKNAQALEGICHTLPIVNYITSEIYRELGDEVQSLVYLRRATANLYEYDVHGAVVQKIWSRRLELELAEAASADVKSCDPLSVVQPDAGRSNIQAQVDYLSTLKWTGTGIAVGGTVLAIAGGALVGVFHSKAKNEFNKLAADAQVDDLNRSNWPNYNRGVHAGYGLLAGGLAMGLTGSVFAILTHLKIVDLESQADLKFSLQASPTGVGVTLTF